MANILKVLKGPLSTLGKKNRNGRIYSRELWENVLQSEYWKDMMTNNSLCGEIVHPGERTESDSWEIDARNISHRIKEAHIEGDKLIGTVEVLDTEQGRNLAELIDAGVTVGISARGMGDVNGDEVDPDTYNFKTFDITMRPSDPNARLVPLTESEKRTFKFINESEETDRLIKGSDEPEVKVERTPKDEVMSYIYSKANMGGHDFEIEPTNHGINFINGDEFLGSICVDTPVESDEDCFIVNAIGTNIGSIRVPANDFENQELDEFIREATQEYDEKVKRPI